MNFGETTQFMCRNSLLRGVAEKIGKVRHEEHLHNELYPLEVGEKYLIRAKIQGGFCSWLLSNGVYEIEDVRYFAGMGFHTQFKVNGKWFVKNEYNFERETN